MLSVSQLLSHHLADLEEGRKEGGEKDECTSCASESVCVCVESEREKKGDWSLFENSNQPIIVFGRDRKENRKKDGKMHTKKKTREKNREEKKYL